MKKLFFTALITLVAVGRAYAQYYYPIGLSTPLYFCPEGVVTCSVKYGDSLVSLDPPPIQEKREYLSSIPWDGLN